MQRKFIIFSHDETKVYSSYKSISNPFMFMTWKIFEELQRIYFLSIRKIIKAKQKYSVICCFDLQNTAIKMSKEVLYIFFSRNG